MVPHMTARIEISYGELLDKITILEFKGDGIADLAQRPPVSNILRATENALG